MDLQRGSHDVSGIDERSETLDPEQVSGTFDQAGGGAMRRKSGGGAGVEDDEKRLPGEGIADISGELKKRGRGEPLRHRCPEKGRFLGDRLGLARADVERDQGFSVILRGSRQPDRHLELPDSALEIPVVCGVIRRVHVRFAYSLPRR